MFFYPVHCNVWQSIFFTFAVSVCEKQWILEKHNSQIKYVCIDQKCSGRIDFFLGSRYDMKN